MKQHRRLWNRLSDTPAIQGEPLPSVPVLEMAGDRRVLIENHCGVTEYGPEKIRIRVRFGILCICGSCLELCHMSKAQLVITGRIAQISIERRNC